LQRPVAFLIVPAFGFANARVSFAGVTPSVLADLLTLGIGASLVIGKLLDLFGTDNLIVKPIPQSSDMPRVCRELAPAGKSAIHRTYGLQRSGHA
jgi:hypothetical protein